MADIIEAEVEVSQHWNKHGQNGVCTARNRYLFSKPRLFQVGYFKANQAYLALLKKGIINVP